MTRIQRIDTDLLYFIRDDPCHQRHPRSIDAIFAANTNCWTVYAIDNRSNAGRSMRKTTRRDILRGGLAATSFAFTNKGESAISSNTFAQNGHGAITDVAGIKVGHFTDSRRPTGCTVILCEEGAVGGVDVRGAAPGTRETDLLDPVNTVQQVHAVVLSGGSAFGLDTATGVMRYLEE